MTRMILVRHGQTDWNRERRIQGATDIPLNDTGRAQAIEAGRSLRDAVGAAPLVVASDLSRAHETARIIAAELDAAEPRLYPGLRERAYGDAEGTTDEEFSARWGSWTDAVVPNAEAPDVVRARALSALQQIDRDLRAEHAPTAQTVIVVTHGALIRQVLLHATGGAYPPVDESLPNATAYPLLMERDRLRYLEAVLV
ncbi:fructose-2,6-bisphosphatase [Microbacterium mangrovi]|uniref:Fructose-2,6-bisphosphatase n=1 Tax=Microbacterium mangrovi TaxID=1348253 RepID=A0A0B1ZVS3_9MICO|nr:histidine phosphatase family protein [Microbacterium mangrovi]KHK95293.1 fructose-2,6-bisphosphatase [Microbacterium mangrovi]